MPLIKRDQILDHLAATCQPDEVEQVFAAALAEAKIPNKRLYKPEEISRLGQALMERAGIWLDAAEGGIQ